MALSDLRPPPPHRAPRDAGSLPASGPLLPPSAPLALALPAVRVDYRRDQPAEALLDLLAPRRIEQLDAAARVAVFLASDDSSWLTGERITASGGR